MAWWGAVFVGSLGIAMLVCVEKIRRGTLRRNAFMGIRVQATYASEEAWRAAHLVARPWWIAATVVCGLAASGFVLAGLAGVDDGRVGTGYLGATLVFLLLVLIPVPAAIRAARQAAPDPTAGRISSANQASDQRLDKNRRWPSSH